MSEILRAKSDLWKSLANVGENMSFSQKSPGRISPFEPAKAAVRDLHLRVTLDLWNAIEEYTESVGEVSVNAAFRRLVRERLVEVGFLKQAIELHPSD